MFCRRAWQRVGPLARKAFNSPCRNAPVQHMSSGVPGNSNNMTYFILCGGGLTAAVIYAYKTVNSDTQRYEDRLANMGTTAKAVDPEVETPPVEEVITESVLIPVELITETAAELTETMFEEAAAVVSEVLVTEATAETAVTEEATPPAAQEVALEAAVVTVETPAETPAVESTGTTVVDEALPTPTVEVETEPAEAEAAEAEAEAVPAADVAA